MGRERENINETKQNRLKSHYPPVPGSTNRFVGKAEGRNDTSRHSRDGRNGKSFMAAFSNLQRSDARIGSGGG